MAATVKIWDPFVRVFHWSLVASFAVAWLTAEDWKALHMWAGYAAGSLIALRLLWGAVGTRYARFSQFVRSPRAVAAYVRDIVTGREARYLGHNPAGGLMIVALIATMATVSVTGWMQTTDAYWGVEWVEELHEAVASLMLGLVGLHVLGVAVASLRHRENLVRAMLTGRKRSPGAADIT
ncbi:cytochrome b/b6 domain-containing protein [Dongia sedimenti]|uniref:Cytochrome b/b6 domain-containing protein n=1 Tax=Dongia sedimenti TaxID=3064282 RepID=A0ABU0YIE5_9PROT|nr:cytochrome b/b6 domain-containing protein [Rhodospirillaceae bacterium R-7]